MTLSNSNAIGMLERKSLIKTQGEKKLLLEEEKDQTYSKACLIIQPTILLMLYY